MQDNIKSASFESKSRDQKNDFDDCSLVGGGSASKCTASGSLCELLGIDVEKIALEIVTRDLEKSKAERLN